MKRIIALAITDIKNISRDSLLLLFLAVPFIVTVALKILLPFAEQLIPQFIPDPGFQLSDHYAFVSSFVIQLTPLLLGAVIGFLILDERDENILLFISVTPFSKTGFIAFRLFFPVLVSVVYTYLVLVILDLVACNWLSLFPVALLAGCATPFGALFMPAFAKNKVEGLALFKVFGLIILGSIAGYLIPEPWNYFAGVVPNFWLMKAFLAHTTPDLYFILMLIGGFIVHGAWIAGLLWFFKRRVG